MVYEDLIPIYPKVYSTYLRGTTGFGDLPTTPKCGFLKVCFGALSISGESFLQDSRGQLLRSFQKLALSREEEDAAHKQLFRTG